MTSDILTDIFGSGTPETVTTPRKAAPVEMPGAAHDTARVDWLEGRRRGLGGSDIAPMLGLSKWKTPYQLYLDKRGELPDQEDNEPMYWGRELEPVIRRRYEQETGYAVTMHEGILQHPDYAFMLANLDGEVNAERLLEVKTARTAEGWGEVGTAEIPLPYSLQCQWYLFVTGRKIADVAVLIGGSDFRMYRVAEDLELQTLLKEAAIEFWQRVQDGNPPEVVTLEDAVQRYGKSDATGQILTSEDVYQSYQRLITVRGQIKGLEAEEEKYKADICRYLGDKYDTVISPDGLPFATWKLAKGRAGFDAKRLQAEHPEIHAQYVTAGEPSRRLLIK